MFNSNLVALCKEMVSDSITNRTQIRTHFGNKESLPFVRFKTACNQAQYDYVSAFGETPFNEIVYIIAHDGDVHKCHCGNKTAFMSIAKGYAMHCSSPCKYSDPAYVKKQKDAKAKLSAEEVAQIAEKRAATNIARYGVEYTMQNKDLAQKQAESYRNRGAK